MTRVDRRLRWLITLLATASLLAACGGRDDESSTSTVGNDSSGGDVEPSPGITDSEVTLGGIYPLSGPASAYGTIAKAVEGCLKNTNEQGGVEMGDGKTRTIKLVVEDDGYAPDRAVAASRKLVEQEQVFALFNTLGTPSNTAIWDYTNQQKIPQFFVATGAGQWGADVDSHSWTIGWQLPYPTEAAIYAHWLGENHPDAKVAVLYQNDDYGKDYLDGFKKAIEGSKITIVEEQSYEVSDPTVDSQVTNLSGTDADVFFNITTPKFAAQAIKKAGELGWKPVQLLNSVSASITSVIQPAGFENAQNIVTATYIKDPSDPQWADDEAMTEYKELIKKYTDVDPNNSFGVYGFAVCESLVKVLEQTEAPTREALMDAVRNMDGIEIGLLLPGITLTTSGSEDGYPIETGQVSKFVKDRFELQGDPISFEGKTPKAE